MDNKSSNFKNFINYYYKKNGYQICLFFSFNFLLIYILCLYLLKVNVLTAITLYDFFRAFLLISLLLANFHLFITIETDMPNLEKEISDYSGKYIDFAKINYYLIIIIIIIILFFLIWAYFNETSNGYNPSTYVDSINNPYLVLGETSKEIRNIRADFLSIRAYIIFISKILKSNSNISCLKKNNSIDKRKLSNLSNITNSTINKLEVANKTLFLSIKTFNNNLSKHIEFKRINLWPSINIVVYPEEKDVQSLRNIVENDIKNLNYTYQNLSKYNNLEFNFENLNSMYAVIDINKINNSVENVSFVLRRVESLSKPFENNPIRIVLAFFDIYSHFILIINLITFFRHFLLIGGIMWIFSKKLNAIRAISINSDNKLKNLMELRLYMNIYIFHYVVILFLTTIIYISVKYNTPAPKHIALIFEVFCFIFLIFVILLIMLINLRKMYNLVARSINLALSNNSKPRYDRDTLFNILKEFSAYRNILAYISILTPVISILTILFAYWHS